MQGVVTERRDAILRIVLCNANGLQQTYDTVVDTGYNGWLTLSSELISSLGFRWQRFGRALLADGSESVFNVYEGTIIWDGQRLNVDIVELDADALVGMSLMYGYGLVLPVLSGATFLIRKIDWLMAASPDRYSQNLRTKPEAVR